jgi:hypothetical protein
MVERLPSKREAIPPNRYLFTSQRFYSYAMNQAKVITSSKESSPEYTFRRNKAILK